MQNLGWMPASREVAALGGAAAVRLDYGDGGPDGEAPRDYCALFVLPRQAGAEGLAATVAAVAVVPAVQRGVAAGVQQAGAAAGGVAAAA